MEENHMPNPAPTVPDSVSFPGSPPPPGKRGSKWIYIVIIFVLLIAVIAFLVFKGSQATVPEGEVTSTPPEVTNTTEESPLPIPSPTPSASKDETRIQVLNGTGITGEAGYLQNQLRVLGYTKVETGNADTQTNTTTEVTYAESVSQDVVDEITNKLKALYQTVETNTSRSLTSTDIQIITGLRVGATAKPVDTSTPTPTPTETTNP